MSEKIVVPALGESVTEATVSKWLKTEGESVDSDEPLVELETDKVNVEVPSPSSGVLENIAVKEGDTVEVGALLGSVGGSSKKKISQEKEKKYKPPEKKEKLVSLNENIKIEKTKVITKNKKPSANGVEPLILEEAHDEPPLVLDDVVEMDVRVGGVLSRCVKSRLLFNPS